MYTHTHVHTHTHTHTMTHNDTPTKFYTLQPDTVQCLMELKKQGYRILVSDIHESSKSVHDFDWAQQKTAVVMGNEVCPVDAINFCVEFRY